MLQNGTMVFNQSMPPNTALKVYINEWVQIQPFTYSQLTRYGDASISTPIFLYDPNDLPVTNDSQRIMYVSLYT